MNNFTKEYIKECDCKEIQGLRPELEKGDYVRYGGVTRLIDVNPRGTLYASKHHRKYITWLPTGDDLDDEIVGICHKLGWRYCTEWNKTEFIVRLGEGINYEFSESNPLIAKIKLLKELLNAN